MIVDKDALFNRSQSLEKYPREFVENLVNQASDLIGPAWSLKNFVASNPLQGLENLNFERAASKAHDYFHAKIFPDELVVFNAYEKSDFEIDNFFEIFQSKISNPEDSFKFASKQISLKDFALSSILKFDPDYQNIVERSKLAKFIDQVSLTNNDFFTKESTVNLVSFDKSSKLFKSVQSSLIRWLERFYDEGQASIEMPNREKGLFRAWKELALLKNLNKQQKNIIRKLPDDAAEAVVVLLISLEIPEEDWEEYLRLSFLALPGWTSYIRWKIDYQTGSDFNQIAPPSLMDYLALRLALEKIFSLTNAKVKQNSLNNFEYRDFVEWIFKGLLKSGFCEKDLFSVNLNELNLLSHKLLELYLKKGVIYLESIENTVNKKLQQQISAALQSRTDSVSIRPEAQMIFCIDVRSEAFRRAIEAQGNYQTYGYAGFFGLPIKYNFLESGESVDSCPVLIKPKHTICEESLDDKLNDIFVNDKNRSFLKSINRSFKDLKVNFASIFVFSEASGLFYGLRILLKTILPKLYYKTQRLILSKLISKIHYEPILNYSHSEEQTITGIGLNDQFNYALNALKMIGLTENFAPFVVFCGHGSHTVNNPYASALDCGACGGSHGGPNAKVIAKILNSKIIREMISQAGIEIPSDTVFLAAQHNTTDDSVEIFSSCDNKFDLKKLKADLEKAKNINNFYRLGTFSTTNVPDLRMSDWSETRPEWGLAGNSSFIIAPRSLSLSQDLKARSFLHSYEYDRDFDGSILETIMTAPMIVTQWINSQYYFSTVNNIHFGSGSKITQNVMGTCAVVQGNSSDLMHGLALQSVNASDFDNYHTPVRITNYIYAPFNKVKNIIDKHDILKKLVYNSWIKVVVIDPETKAFVEI